MSDAKQSAIPAGNQLIEGGAENAEYQAGNSNAPSTLHSHDAEKATQPNPPGRVAPDGGAAAWLVVLGAWCTSFCSFGWLNSMPDSHRTLAQLFTLTTTRCWNLPGVLPK